MDPLTIAGTAATLTKTIAQTTISLYSFMQAAKKVHKTARLLHDELKSLQLVVTTIESSLRRPSLQDTAAAAQTGIDFWILLDTSLNNCQVACDGFDHTLNDIITTPQSIWKKAMSQFRLELAYDDIQMRRSQIQSHISCLSVSLQVLQL